MSKKDIKQSFSEKQLVSFNKTMERFSKEKKKEVTLQDLQSEVNKLKLEIKDLKAQDKIFADALSFSQQKMILVNQRNLILKSNLKLKKITQIAHKVQPEHVPSGYP